MADTNMPEMDLINFINNVHLIKDLPIICKSHYSNAFILVIHLHVNFESLTMSTYSVMSSESDKDTVKEAVIKGACFFLEKPISSKNLKNVWQHAYRKRRYQETRGDIKTNSNGGAKIEQDDEEEEEGDRDLKITKESTLQENKSEEIGDSDQVDNNLDNLSSEGKKPTKLAGIRTKRSAPTENDGPQEVIKRKRTKSWGGSSHIQFEFSTMMANATEKLELMSELASSSKSLDRKQFRASVRANKGKVEESGAQCSAERKGQKQL